MTDDQRALPDAPPAVSAEVEPTPWDRRWERIDKRTASVTAVILLMASILGVSGTVSGFVAKSNAQDDASQLRSQLSAAKKTSGALQERVNNLDTLNGSLNQEVSDLKEANDKLTNTTAQLKASNTDLNKQLTDLKNVSKLSGGTSGVDDPAVRNKAAVTLKPEDFQVVDVEAQDSSDWMAYDASASISVSQNGLELTNVEMLNIKKTKARYSNCNALTSFDSRATVPISDHTAGDYLCFRATSNHRILAGHILSIDRTSKAIRVDLMSWELPS